ncbi:DNA polymerase III subunit beta [Candidatus Parcubacteria bacterium]|nr:MAG: DNA polymerase III subunit beta [Candidatus Parcubacteria bacterium]
MKVLQENLIHVLSVAGEAVAGNSSLPILSSYLLSADSDGTLQVTATNLDMTITTWTTAASNGSPARFVLPARQTQQWVASLPPDVVTLEVDGNQATAQCAASKATLKCMPVDDYPPIQHPTPDSEEVLWGITVDLNVFLKYAGLVTIAAPRELTGRPLDGILFTYQDGRLKLAASDGYRLSVASMKADLLTNKAEPPQQAVVPVAAVEKLLHIAKPDDNPSQITILCTPNHVSFASLDRNFQMTAGRVNGKYPEYERVIPDSSQTTVLLPMQELFIACRRADIFARDTETPGVTLTVENEHLTISNVSAVTGKSKSNLQVSVDGEPTNHVTLNSQFLLKLLSAAKRHAASIKIGISDATSPVTFSLLGVDNFIHIIMPLNL